MTLDIQLITDLNLAHKGDCAFLGVDAESLAVYVEETYDEETWLAQYMLQISGQITASADEASGENPDFQPLPLPSDLIRPMPRKPAHPLNFSGPRYRGLRATDRIADMVHPLSMSAKMMLIQRLNLPFVPPMLLGVAESYVMAEALLHTPDFYFICRRLRLAYAMSVPQHDANHQPYDYDTLTIYAAQFYLMGEDDGDLLLSQTLTELAGVELGRPMDCILYNHYLYIADGGTSARNSAVRIWHINS